MEVGCRLNAVYDKLAHNQLVRHFLQNRLAAGQETIRVEHYDEIQQSLNQLGIVSSTDTQRYFIFQMHDTRLATCKSHLQADIRRAAEKADSYQRTSVTEGITHVLPQAKARRPVSRGWLPAGRIILYARGGRAVDGNGSGGSSIG